MTSNIQPVLNESLTLTCSYTGNETVDYFVWRYNTSTSLPRILDVVRTDTCNSTYDIDVEFTNFVHEVKCADSNTNSVIFEHVPYMHAAGITCTAIIKDKNIPSEYVQLNTYGE